ncbi:MAG: agmatine deiminase family protein [Phycisphaerales bacterium]|nr:agmatine deiminase family protein [Phycisphaerales bacterium]
MIRPIGLSAKTKTLCACVAAASVSTLAGATPIEGPQWDEPILVDGQLVFEEGARIPKAMTDTERRFIGEDGIMAPRGGTAPPIGPIRCASEYEPMAGIILAWEGYSSIMRQMAAHITTTGDADVYVACDSSSEANSARNAMVGAGADPDRVFTFVRSTDTVWIRDYGPRYIFEGDCRAIVDHTYNRPRPNDNSWSSWFDAQVGHAYYEHELVHGGGNFHLNGVGVAAASKLISNENGGMSDAQIIDIWRQYQNVETYLHDPFPTNVDSTQHIDMWMQITDDQEIIISDWPTASGSTQDNICDWAAGYYQGLGWTVYRTPAFTSGWTHFTYTNMVICNDLVLLPKYADISDSWDSQALATVQAAMPNRTVVQITCDDLAYSAGVMHCITMHMPAHVGGVNPTTCVRYPLAGASYEAGQTIAVNWISDDDEFNVVSVDIDLSTNGGATWTSIASGGADDGYHTFAAPNVSTSAAHVRVTARDADGNTGASQSAAFTIESDQIAGDANGDGIVNVNDILLVVSQFGCASSCSADVDGDDQVTATDILMVLANWTI